MGKECKNPLGIFLINIGVAGGHVCWGAGMRRRTGQLEANFVAPGYPEGQRRAEPIAPFVPLWPCAHSTLNDGGDPAMGSPSLLASPQALDAVPLLV